MILQYNQFIILDPHDYLNFLIYLDYVLFDLSGSCRVRSKHAQHHFNLSYSSSVESHHIHPYPSTDVDDVVVGFPVMFLFLENCDCVCTSGASRPWSKCSSRWKMKSWPASMILAQKRL